MTFDLDLGDGHTLAFVQYKDELSGCNVFHSKPDGTSCSGWIAFAGMAWDREFASGKIATWTVESMEPLTLAPSILCRACGDHGFIRGGKWERA